MAKMPLSTGVVYDLRMAEHRCLWDPDYPEHPGRLLSVLARCEELKLLGQCERLPATEATREELLRCHTPELIDLLERTGEMTEEELKEVSARFDCLYLHPTSWRAALLSAGSSLALLGAVLDGVVGRGFALVRPPGHHAMKENSCGYCLVNNVALCARAALARGVSRVLIVDWDVHHGQGTQREFYGDNRVLYVSIHRYEHGGWWPNLRESNFDHVGAGPGVGYNCNIPLNKVGMTDG